MPSDQNGADVVRMNSSITKEGRSLCARGANIPRLNGDNCSVA
jgi:hypothetical protein